MPLCCEKWGGKKSVPLIWVTYLKGITFIYIERNLFDCDFGGTGKLDTFNGSRSLHCSFYHKVPSAPLWASSEAQKDSLMTDSYVGSESNRIQLMLVLIYCGNNTVTIKPKKLKDSQATACYCFEIFQIEI